MKQNESKLTIGLASSALFDLTESDRVFREQGTDAYAAYQLAHEDEILEPGIALPFIRRLLSLNALREGAPVVEIILLSRNNLNTGLRVMNSAEAHGIAISQAHFLQGGSPASFIEPLGIDLFLSANEIDVRRVLSNGYAAGQCLNSHCFDDPNDAELRLAFDFDGVLADDASESVYQRAKNLDEFHAHEVQHSEVAHKPGPLKSFVDRIYQIQLLEQAYAEKNIDYMPRLNVAIVTARSAPAHKRVINTMRAWNLHPNQAFFMGGNDKTAVLSQYKPHMFFDDQRVHLDRSSVVAPAVHVPFGEINQPVQTSVLCRPELMPESEYKLSFAQGGLRCAQ